MNFDYEIIEDDYGRKLAIDFEYDENIIQKIKSLPWEETHRRWTGERWTIDYNHNSVSLFENELGVMVPPEYRPGENEASGTVKFIVPENYTWFFIENPRADVDKLLYQELAYETDGYEYTEAYKQGRWDGWQRLYNKDNHGAPKGLLGRAVELVEELGYETEVTIEGDRSGADADFGWEFPHELRDYQSDAVMSVLDQRGGIVSLPTGVGKTITALRAMQFEGQKSLVLVHTKELLYQWADEIRNALDVEPGLIGDGRWSEGDGVTVAIIQTLMSRGTNRLDDDYGVLVFDECHRTSAADQMHQIGMDVDADVRIGLSATPWRSTDGEELKIEGAIGQYAYEATAEEMIDDEYLAEPEFEFIDSGDITAEHGEDYQSAYRRVIELNPSRNANIAMKAAQLARDGYKVLINVDRIRQGRLLEHALNDASIDETLDKVRSRLDEREMQEFQSALMRIDTVAPVGAEFLYGGDDTPTRQDTLERFENGDLDVLVSTILQEGVDIPDISAIVLAQAGKSDIAQIQTIGRALRPSNGDHAKIVDVADRGNFFGEQFTKRKEALKDYYGAYGP